ncbi:MAG TPA: nitroreductase family protein [Egibacteraceae bacterium]|nr:nitroreductase family protein [Egibacteraceae bacterium]
MELSDVVRRRRMVRAYRPEPVERAVLERILDTARRAPSAGYAQGQHFVVLTGQADRMRLAELCDEARYVAEGFEPWLSRAPVHVVPCVRPADYDTRYAAADKATSSPPREWRVPFWWVDAGASLMLLLLATVDEGLAGGMLALADTPELRNLLSLPDDVQPLGVVTIGHPAPDRRSGSLARGRRPLHEVVHHGRWNAT